MIKCCFDWSVQNFQLWKITGFVLGAVNLAGNIWLVYEFFGDDPIESNASYVYISIAYVFYILRWLLSIGVDFVETLMKVLVGEIKSIDLIFQKINQFRMNESIFNLE